MGFGPQSDLQNLPFSFGFLWGLAVDVGRPKVFGARRGIRGHPQGENDQKLSFLGRFGFGSQSRPVKCAEGAPN